MARRNRQWWQQAVSDWKASGISAAAFAAGLGVRASTLRWWAWLFRSEACQVAESDTPPSFVELVAVRPAVATTACAAPDSAGVSIECGDVVVRSQQWPSAEWVASLALHFGGAR